MAPVSPGIEVADIEGILNVQVDGSCGE